MKKRATSEKLPYMSRIPKKWKLIKGEYINKYKVLRGDDFIVTLSDPDFITTSIAKKTNRSQNDVCMEILNWETDTVN
ncbi:hypothetical protein ACWGOQ_0019895 [Aquimarina sp. M1]